MLQKTDSSEAFKKVAQYDIIVELKTFLEEIKTNEKNM